jgi:aminopeptidase N
VEDAAVHGRISKAGKHTVGFEYTATATRGFRWLTGGPGLFTAFHCDAWMICANSPEQRATLRLEIVVQEDGLRAAGPGRLSKEWRDGEGHHWLFETTTPVQTFLFSFGVARLVPTVEGRFAVFAAAPGHLAALKHTANAARFFRDRTGIDAVREGYRQVFLPQAGVFGQEAAGQALMTQEYLERLESKEDVVLMAHELAHQWWGVMVGIRSWSDFWLNEGMAEYVSLLYLREVGGNDAFLEEMKKLRSRMDELRRDGKDRPLHFEGWKDATEALGPVPYVKGALFLDRLRSETGDALFWRALALYTRRHAGGLVESGDFQRAVQEATGRDLRRLFDEAVYGR